MEKAIKLSEWAEKHGINYQTAYRWYKAGKLPAKNIIKTPTGTILVEELETFTDRDEAIMTDETQPIARRLASAYKFIQSQENNKPPIEKYEYPKEDVSIEEKQRILKDLNLLSESPMTTIPYCDGHKLNPKTIEEKIEYLHRQISELKENNKIFKHDLKECASNIFGDEKTFMNRVRTYCRHDFIEFLEKVVNNSKTIEEIKEKINTLKYEKEQQEL